MAGRTLGHYRLVEQIATGDMGVVYRAHGGRSARQHAVVSHFRQMLLWAWIGVLGRVLFSRANFAQQLVPARAGPIARSQGRVLLNEHAIGETLESLSPLWEMREGGNLRTESGRVAVFLAPEALLFAAEDTHLEPLSSRFSDVRLRLIYGSAIAEVYVLV